MAACGKLQHMFNKPLPENPTLIESLSWNHIKSKNTNHVDQPSFTEIFGELYFKEVSDLTSSMACSASSSTSSSSVLSSSSSVTCTDVNQDCHEPEKHGKSSEESKKVVQPIDPFSSKCYRGSHNISDSFSSMSSESLQLCTEGLGFESSDNSDDLETQDYWQDLKRSSRDVKHSTLKSQSSTSGEIRRPRVRRGPFPPPISCIGKSRKPGVCFKSYKQDGRFVLKEIPIPTQECLHASRKDGRLKLHFINKDDKCNYPVVVFEDQENEDENK
ncbi:unnamed protein product [Rhodiola kirilowii]